MRFQWVARVGIFIFILTSGFVHATESGIQIQIEPIGMSQEEAEVLAQVLLAHEEPRARLAGTRHRLIHSEIDEEHYTLAVYDYTHDRLIRIRGNLNSPSESARPFLHETFEQPVPSEEEYEEALQLLARDPVLGGPLSAGEFEAYRAMPEIIDPRPAEQQLRDASQRIHRVMAIGMRPRREGLEPEVVGVDLSAQTVIRYPDRAPPTCLATLSHCGYPSAGQAVTRRGTAGSAAVTIRDSQGLTVWRFTLVRPSASSGYWGSGTDIRNVYYRGKLVLAQMHVPILNVNYDRNVCGPYRDWMYTENPFRATGSLIASGILRASSKPTTILDTGSDYGTFRGAAIYTQGSETLLVSELSAGWYRYASVYKFHLDGTIRPELGFSGVYNSCVCQRHHHHAYWRFDFDIGTATRNSVQVHDGSSWTNIATERKFFRSASVQKWRVLDLVNGGGYEVIPGSSDGPSNTYGRGDAWVLRYRSGEVDDSRAYTGTAANLDAFLTGESVNNTDVVFWYAGHFTHDSDDGSAGHFVGPVLKPF